MSLTNIKITPADGWVELSSNPYGSFSLPAGGQYCFYAGNPPKELIGHKFIDGVKNFTTKDGESLFVKVSYSSLGVCDLNKGDTGSGGGGVVFSYAYNFLGTNTDFLQIASYTGNFKIMLAASSETGIPSEILEGRIGEFTPSLDVINNPIWMKYEIDGLIPSIVLMPTFTGICSKYAKDDVWQYINMGSSQ